MPSPELPAFSAQLDQLGELLRRAVERLHGQEIDRLDPWERVAGVAAALDCWVCPRAADLHRYGGWQAALHEIGHFAIAPRFLWNAEAHITAAAAGQRPEAPRVWSFAIALDACGGIVPAGCVPPGGGLWAENPHPLSDWHVRAWQWWACNALRLEMPERLWLQTTPWAELLSSAKLDTTAMDRPRRWCDRHPERTEIWRKRAAMPLIPERELAWRLADVFSAPWIAESRKWGWPDRPAPGPTSPRKRTAGQLRTSLDAGPRPRNHGITQTPCKHSFLQVIHVFGAQRPRQRRNQSGQGISLG